MDNTAGIQVIAELFQTVLKFLERTAVQRQLIAILLSLIVAWILSKPLVNWLDRLQQRWVDAHDSDAESETEGGPRRSPLQRSVRLLLRLVSMLAFPITAILLTGVNILLFQSMGWISGLFNDVLILLGMFLAYRLFIVALYALFDEQKVLKYHNSFFRPLFVVAIFLLIINGITDLSALAPIPLFPLFGGFLTLGTLFLATIGLYLWIAATGLLKEILQGIFTARTHADPRAVEASLILLRYLLIAIAIIATFQLIGFDPTTLAAVLGGLSVGIGFALQDVFKNFLGGIILLFEGSIRPGDWVEVEGKIGKVEGLNIRHTIVRTLDNVKHIVPNQDYLSSTIVGYTSEDPGSLVKVPVGVPYGADIREVQTTLVDVAKNHADIKSDPAPAAPLINFGETGLDFALLGWVRDVQQKGGAEAQLRVAIFDAFKQKGIEMLDHQLIDVRMLNALPESEPVNEPNSGNHNEK